MPENFPRASFPLSSSRVFYQDFRDAEDRRAVRSNQRAATSEKTVKASTATVDQQQQRWPNPRNHTNSVPDRGRQKDFSTHMCRPTREHAQPGVPAPHPIPTFTNVPQAPGGRQMMAQKGRSNGAPGS